MREKKPKHLDTLSDTTSTDPRIAHVTQDNGPGMLGLHTTRPHLYAFGGRAAFGISVCPYTWENPRASKYRRKISFAILSWRLGIWKGCSRIFDTPQGHEATVVYHVDGHLDGFVDATWAWDRQAWVQNPTYLIVGGCQRFGCVGRSSGCGVQLKWGSKTFL